MQPPESADRPDLASALHQARAGRARAVNDLVEWLRVPSVSGSQEHRGALNHSAHMLAQAMKSVGGRVYQRAGERPPFLVGVVRGPKDRPVVLFYGHYDVVPAGAGWTSEPFAPVCRAGHLVARGANDDKGQLFAVLSAIGAWSRAGAMPCTAILVAEGGEEIGSPHLRESLQALASEVRPHVVLACDTERFVTGAPSVTVSQRGHMVVRVAVDVGGSPVHAGRLGGAVIDPSQVLSRLQLQVTRALPTLCSTSPVASRPGRVRALDDAAVRRLAPGRATWPDGLYQRVTRSPALTVVAVKLNARGASVPSRAVGRWDLRLPPGCNVKVTLERLAALCRSTSRAVRVEVKVDSANAGFSAWPPPEVLAAIDRASFGSFGCAAAIVRSGGSLPAAMLLQESFGVTPVLLGLGTAGGRAHAPDEHLDLAGWHRCVELLVRFLADPMESRVGSNGAQDVNIRHVRSPKRLVSFRSVSGPQHDVR